MKVLIAGGGTAGHVFPAIALGEELRDRGVETTFVGTSRGLEVRLVPAAGFELVALDVIGFPRRLSADLIRAPLALRSAIKRCRPLVRDHSVVVGMGGYASAPAVLAAGRDVPIVLHEQNAVPGLANRWLAPRAGVVAVSFPEAVGRFRGNSPCVMTGNPVRRAVASMDRAATRPEALEALGLQRDRTTILVFGGSQGALHLDTTVAEVVSRWRDRSDIQIVVLTGTAHLEVSTSASEAGAALIAKVLPFLDRMELAYAAADLVVARAGATSIAEITACGLPALLIPYPYATDDHQMANARSLEAVGAAEVMADTDLSAGSFMTRVDSLLADHQRRERMGRAALERGTRGAAAALADLVAEASG